MRFKILASVALLSVFSTSYAKEVYSSGQWTLDDLSSRSQPNASCIAFTEAEISNTLYRLEFIHPKDKLAPTEVFLRIGNSRAAKSWKATLKNGKTLSFSYLQKNGRNEESWNLPQHNGDLLAQLEDRKDIDFRPADGSRDVRLKFSADGFKRVKEKMQERCLKNAPLIDTEFETAFILNKEDINPMDLSVDEVKELRRLLNLGYNVHLDIQKNKNDVVALGNRFKNQINESKSLTSLIERLTSSDIPKTISDIRSNDDLESTKKSELAQINQDIGVQNTSISQAERTLQTADAAIAPFQNEHSSRSESVQYARNQVNQNGSTLNQIDNSIASTSSRIDQLNNEAYNLQNQNNSLRVELRDARSDLQRSNQMFRSFDSRQETRRRIQDDRAYQANRRDLPSYESALASLARALAEARGKLLTREAELRACQARTAFITSEFGAYRIPAQTRPNRDGQDRPTRPTPTEDRPDRPERPGRDSEDRPTRPGNPGPTTPTPGPTTPTPGPTTPTTPTTPTVDCSAQVEAVRVAKAVETDIQGQHRDAVQRLEGVQTRMNMIENRIENEVETERAALAQRANQAERRLAQVESTLISNERRIEIISNQSIPQEQNTLYSLESSRPAVQSQYEQNTANLSRLEAELASFERRVGWDAKVSAVNNATNTLNERRNILARTMALKRSTESVLSNCQAERTRLNNQLSARQLQKAQSENRLVEVKKSLEPFEQETSRLEGVANDLKNQLSGHAIQFENQI